MSFQLENFWTSVSVYDRKATHVHIFNRREIHNDFPNVAVTWNSSTVNYIIVLLLMTNEFIELEEF